MKDETMAAIMMLLKADESVSCDKRNEILAACRREQRKHRRLATVRQAAEALGCHAKTVQRYAEKGLLTTVRFSLRKIRYDMDEVEAFARDGIGGGKSKETP